MTLPAEDTEFREGLFARVVDWFGFDSELFENYLFFRANSKAIHIVNRDCIPPVIPEPLSVGMPFMRIRMQYPKLTTAAALLFGPHAVKNYIEIDRPRVDQFFRRQPVVVTIEEAERCSKDGGYVMLRFEGLTIGLGLLDRSEPRSCTVFGFHPKAWQLNEETTAFSGAG